MIPLLPFAAKYSEIIFTTFGGGHYTAIYGCQAQTWMPGPDIVSSTCTEV